MLMVEFPEVREKGYVLGIAVSLMQCKTDVAIELMLYLGRNPFLPMSYLRTGSDSMGQLLGISPVWSVYITVSHRGCCPVHRWIDMETDLRHLC